MWKRVWPLAGFELGWASPWSVKEWGNNENWKLEVLVCQAEDMCSPTGRQSLGPAKSPQAGGEVHGLAAWDSLLMA